MARDIYIYIDREKKNESDHKNGAKVTLADRPPSDLKSFERTKVSRDPMVAHRESLLNRCRVTSILSTFWYSSEELFVSQRGVSDFLGRRG